MSLPVEYSALQNVAPSLVAAVIIWKACLRLKYDASWTRDAARGGTPAFPVPRSRDPHGLTCLLHHVLSNKCRVALLGEEGCSCSCSQTEDVPMAWIRSQIGLTRGP